jgi:hypothetical protein
LIGHGFPDEIVFEDGRWWGRWIGGNGVCMRLRPIAIFLMKSFVLSRTLADGYMQINHRNFAPVTPEKE